MSLASPGTLCLSAGFKEALLFIKTKQIPDTWKMDMSEILESSSSDEGEGKESEEEEKEPEPEEVRNGLYCINIRQIYIFFIPVCGHVICLKVIET